ncbi:MAG TPA: metallophosphoesterase [Allosphingosinicella sp.]|uniref:metallophosphoesterase n=1 Tax=Allosphingosinicella sp. TaxID=2823234 RepID=UPI002ED98970
MGNPLIFRMVRRVGLALLAAGFSLLLYMGLLAQAEPRVRRLGLTLEGLSSRKAPIRIILISDIHAGTSDMSPARVSQLVEKANSLKPDLVLLAGDFISDKEFPARRNSIEDSVAPLGALRAPLGTLAVLGNHDHWLDAKTVREALQRNGITVLENGAVRRGPLAVGGVDDIHTGHDDITATSIAMAEVGGAKLLLSHSPDIFPRVPEDVKLTLSGHTHCGQIALPFFGIVRTASNYGRRFACGIIKEGDKVLVVSGGVGTSVLPLRLLAPPDIWLITLRPE